MAQEYKLVFTGSMGAGKTTAIGVISEIPPVHTDVANSEGMAGKAGTTTALDYGEVTLAAGERLRLYGTPGQSRFDFMWELLGRGALGVVILIDNAAPTALEDLVLYTDAFRDLVTASRAVIGISRTESHPAPDLDAHHRVLAQRGFKVPVLSVDVRRRDDVLLLLNVLFHQMEMAAIHAAEPVSGE